MKNDIKTICRNRCPTCNAAPGVGCRAKSGSTVKPHTARTSPVEAVKRAIKKYDDLFRDLASR